MLLVILATSEAVINLMLLLIDVFQSFVSVLSFAVAVTGPALNILLAFQATKSLLVL